MIKHAIAAALAVTATHSAALSLGGTQGNAIIGRPLDLVVRSSIDAAEAAGGLCLEAELMYGDSRVPASAVSVSVHKLATDGSGALRVRSSLPVNEPVVTLVIKAGCSSRFTRSYALLADYLQQPVAEPVAPVRELATPRVKEVLEPSRAEAAVAKAMPAKAAVARAEPPLRRASPAARPAAERESPIRLQPAQPRPAGVGLVQSKRRPESARPVPESNESAVAAAPRAAAGHDSGARLKLDLVDLGQAAAEVDKGASAAAAGQPGTTVPLAQPASAVAGGEPAGADPQRMQEMVRELEGLRSEQEKMRAAVEAVNARLAVASGPRYLDPLVLGLFGVSAAALSALAWLWAKLRRQQQLAERARLDEAWRLSAAASAQPD